MSNAAAALLFPYLDGGRTLGEMSDTRQFPRRPEVDGALEAGASEKLKRDLDLGLRMVEGLVRIGEVGSAIRLTEELRAEAADVLQVPASLPRVRHTRRGTTVVVGVAVALGVGLSAAAWVGPNATDEPAARVPQIERHTEPVSEDLVGGSESLKVEEGTLDGDAPVEARVQGPATEDDDTVDRDRRRMPRVDPPDEVPDPLEPPPLPLIVPLPPLPTG